VYAYIYRTAAVLDLTTTDGQQLIGANEFPPGSVVLAAFAWTQGTLACDTVTPVVDVTDDTTIFARITDFTDTLATSYVVTPDGGATYVPPLHMGSGSNTMSMAVSAGLDLWVRVSTAATDTGTAAGTCHVFVVIGVG